MFSKYRESSDEEYDLNNSIPGMSSAGHFGYRRSFPTNHSLEDWTDANSTFIRPRVTLNTNWHDGHSMTPSSEYFEARSPPDINYLWNSSPCIRDPQSFYDRPDTPTEVHVAMTSILEKHLAKEINPGRVISEVNTAIRNAPITPRRTSSDSTGYLIESTTPPPSISSGNSQETCASFPTSSIKYSDEAASSGHIKPDTPDMSSTLPGVETIPVKVLRRESITFQLGTTEIMDKLDRDRSSSASNKANNPPVTNQRGECKTNIFGSLVERVTHAFLGRRYSVYCLFIIWVCTMASFC
jgi:hypothetical protein